MMRSPTQKLPPYFSIRPIAVNKFLLDTGFRLREILREQFPRRIEHFIYLDVDIYSQQPGGILLRVIQTTQIVVTQVETVFQFGLCILGISVEPHSSVHDLVVVFSGLLADDQLFQTGEGAERVDDDLSGIRIRTQVELALRDVTGERERNGSMMIFPESGSARR